MSYSLYKILHLLGALALVTSLAGYTFALLDRGSVEGRARKLAIAMHGIALVILLISGFGILAKLSLGFPTWVWVKLSIWLVLGGYLTLARKLPRHALLWWLGVPTLALIAAAVGFLKPFV